MSHPSSFYVRYLLAKGFSSGNENLQTVQVTLQALGLPRIDSTAFDEIRDSFVPPGSFYFQNRKHLQTCAFMREQKIFTLWSPKPEERSALDLLRLPLAREATQMLLIGRLPGEDIARRIGGRFKLELSSRTVQTYAHYFWNVELCSFADWADLLHGNPQRDAYLSSLVGTPNQALYRAGFSPQISGKVALREAHRAIAMRLEATRRFPDTRDAALMITALSKALLDVNAALHGEGAGMEEMMKEFLKFKMTRPALNVVPIHKLAKAGNFSGSGVKESSKTDGAADE